jgi:hypothetical protein
MTIFITFFGSKCVYKNSKYAVYENPYYINLGHSVDSYYRFNKVNDTSKLNYSDFYSNLGGTSGYYEMFRNEQVYLNGAIFDDDDTLDETEFPISDAPSLYSLGDYTDISSTVRVTSIITRLKIAITFRIPALSLAIQKATLCPSRDLSFLMAPIPILASM